MISSASNNQIKNIGKLLKSSKVRREQGVFVIEGIKMFLEAKRLGLVEKAFLTEELYHFWIDGEQMEGVVYEVVSDKVFKEITDTMTPQGIIALVRMHDTSYESILEGDKLRLVFLENLRDPGNLGTIVRTAEGAGMTGIILSKESVDSYNPKVVRATMGSIFRMPVLYVEHIGEAMKKAQEAGVVLYATHLKGEKFYDEVSYGMKTGIVTGNEANGLTEETAAQADTCVKIPMCGQVESLNAAVATSVMMYEIFRQSRIK